MTTAVPRAPGLVAAHRGSRASTILVAFAGLVVLALSFACGGSDGNDVPDKIAGLITEVRSDDQNRPTFIRLRDKDARTWELPVELDPDADVTALHLEEHRVQQLPVIVTVRESANGIYAARIDDVPPD